MFRRLLYQIDLHVTCVWRRSYLPFTGSIFQHWWKLHIHWSYGLLNNDKLSTIGWQNPFKPVDYHFKCLLRLLVTRVNFRSSFYRIFLWLKGENMLRISIFVSNVNIRIDVLSISGLCPIVGYLTNSLNFHCAIFDVFFVDLFNSMSEESFFKKLIRTSDKNRTREKTVTLECH